MAIPISSIISYTLIAVVGYILVGSPLTQIFSNRSAREDILDNSNFNTVSEDLILPRKDLQCQELGYNVRILSREPLVVYLENFLSDDEARHLIDLSIYNFKPSTVFSGTEERMDESVRKSEKAPLERDSAVQCIEKRAIEFQGWRPDVFVERLWTQRYHVSGHYKHHYDWSMIRSRAGRIASFMVYLSANCTGGGTNFPRLAMPSDHSWCEFLECKNAEGREGLPRPGEDDDKSETAEEGGVTFKPIRGNAVYWENLRPDMTGGYEESFHAALPVKSGVKIGMNIWLWYQKGYQRFLEEQRGERSDEEKPSR